MVESLNIFDVKPVKMPDMLYDTLKQGSNGNRDKKPLTLEPVAPGKRNDTLARIAGKLINQGIDIETAYFTANGWNNSLPEPLDEKEVRTTVESIFKTHERNHPQCEADTDTAVSNQKTYRCTDIGNGERFADQHRGVVRYSHPERKWYVWTGKSWEKDSKRLVRNQPFDKTQCCQWQEVNPAFRYYPKILTVTRGC